jgi:DNA-binding NarL/FixJ family response regulator
MMIRILLADDYEMVRAILCQIIEKAGDLQVIAMASNGQEALNQAIKHCPDVAVLDLSMPIMDGVEATKQICSKCPGIGVLMVSTYNTPQHIHRSIEAGALGYILKDEVKRDLLTAIRCVFQGDRYFSKPIIEVAKLYIGLA